MNSERCKRVSGGRLPEALFLVFRLESQGATGTARAACLAHLLFSTSPGLAALPRSDGFFSGPVCLVRRTLARSAFHGFSIDSKGAKACKSCRSRQDLCALRRVGDDLYQFRDGLSNGKSIPRWPTARPWCRRLKVFDTRRKVFEKVEFLRE